MIYPGAVWRPVTNHGGPMTAHLGLVLHVQEGTGSLHGYFDTPGGQASSTWWVAKTGHVEQYVDANAQAWAQAAGNTTYNSVETEGYETDPLTDAQIHALGLLYAWGHTTYGWPLVEANTPGEHGLGVHYMGGVAWSPKHHTCPGHIRAGQRPLILAAALPAPVPVPKEGHDVPHVIRVDTDHTANYEIVGTKPDGSLVLWHLSEPSALSVRGNGGCYSQVTAAEFAALSTGATIR